MCINSFLTVYLLVFFIFFVVNLLVFLCDRDLLLRQCDRKVSIGCSGFESFCLFFKISNLIRFSVRVLHS